MKQKIVLTFVLLFLTAGLLQAQSATPVAKPQAGPDPFAGSFFSPELVIQNQTQIGLSDDQRAYLKNEIRQAQLKFTDLQWKLQDEVEKMVALVKQPHPDEQKVLAQLENVLSAEHEIKKQQVTLMVRIKNKLTPEQQAKLDDLRR
jgi:Spy/CpxP family protein refolding chaperone